MNAEKLYISTIAADAPELARRHGLGLEIAEYCTAYNMDEGFPENDAAVREKIAGGCAPDAARAVQRAVSLRH